jgi:hypothetical protein
MTRPKLQNRARLILSDETSQDSGYIIEHGIRGGIVVSFWTFNDTTSNDGYAERAILYKSLENLYEHTKEFVESALIDYSPLHISKYKMCGDFIAYYESNM